MNLDCQNFIRRCSSKVEQLICNQWVGGSIPLIGLSGYGEVPEWPKGADCKSAGSAFEGSNPSLSTYYAAIAQLARAEAFQASGRGFESRLPLLKIMLRKVGVFISFIGAHVAQLAEHILGKDEVTSSILVVGL
jgi:hypothetical protein